MGALVAGNGCCCSHSLERLWVLSSLGTVDVVLVSGSVRGCSRCWERSILVLLLGAFVSAFVAGNG